MLLDYYSCDGRISAGGYGIVGFGSLTRTSLLCKFINSLMDFGR
jgi:hypothetical protein